MKKLKQGREKKTGYFCEVKKFVDEQSSIEYAKKELKKANARKDEYRYRLSREIELLKELQGHPNIIELIDFEKSDEDIWYLMPYAKYNLYDYIKDNNQNLSKKDRFNIASQIINAIKHAHDKGIVHRDISPTNVLVFEDDGKFHCKVCDFGLGKDQESLSHYTKSSASGYGQILYVSPEQKVKLKDSSERSDIYSLGKLVYFIFTGKDPSNYRSFELDTLYSKATDDNPENRHQTINEFKKHFNALKDLELNQKIPIEYLSLNDLIKSGEKWDWLFFHKLLKKSNYSSHVYSDYLAPVFEIFSLKPKRLEYYQAVGNSIVEGFQKLSQGLFECYKTTGWPFSQMSTFGSILKAFAVEIPNSEVRLICLEHLWHLAYAMNQWAVIPMAKQIFTSKYISPDIETRLAEIIIKSDAEINMDTVKEFSDLPKGIKSAMIKAVQNTEDEKRKRQQAYDNEF